MTYVKNCDIIIASKGETAKIPPTHPTERQNAMARPKKARVICAAPKHRLFSPTGIKNADTVHLADDEYEVFRLHDLEHLTQSQVADQMLIARTTVTALLYSAHEKLADAIVNGKRIVIEGGSCDVCKIGKACPKANGTCCHKKHRCAASCRYAQQSKNEN